MINTILEEYNKTELSYNVSNVVENVDVQKTETPNNLIKTKILLKNKLNKVTLQSLNDFQNNINMNSSEISSSQYFCMLNNHIQNYRMDKQSGRTNLKFGDYLDSNYAFINNLCSSLLSTHDANNIKLIDFGLAKRVNPNEIMNKPNGTPYYIAPEVLKGSYKT
jgi:hypothetical protein